MRKCCRRFGLIAERNAKKLLCQVPFISADKSPYFTTRTSALLTRLWLTFPRSGLFTPIFPLLPAIMFTDKITNTFGNFPLQNMIVGLDYDHFQKFSGMMNRFFGIVHDDLLCGVYCRINRVYPFIETGDGNRWRNANIFIRHRSCFFASQIDMDNG